MTYLFENTPAHNINGWLSSWNSAGLAFARSHGFTEAGRIPRAGMRDGVYVEDVMIDILKPEWLARKGDTNAA